ncbi:MAG: hypothetical protein E5V18_01000 [Mesorhizobium sp.]|nr:MAG: hypothetical protein E5V18_01000 [Mesorhizobium sp.]
MKLRTYFSAGELHHLARNSKDGSQSSRPSGWIARRYATGAHGFNTAGPDGLVDECAPGPASRLSHEQQTELAVLGPDRGVYGVVRWRRIDMKKAIEDRFGS